MRDRGFTMIEFLIAMVMLGIIATIVIFAVSSVDDDRRQDCINRGGQVVEDSSGNFHQCWLPVVQK